MEESGCVDQLNFALALRTLVFGKYPDIRGDTGVVEQIRRQRDDSLDQVALQKLPADLALTGHRTPGEQRTPVFNDSGTAEVVIHFIDCRLQK